MFSINSLGDFISKFKVFNLFALALALALVFVVAMLKSTILKQHSVAERQRAADLGVVLDLNRVGHLGHSWGAYTAHAVAGGRFEHARMSELRDERVVVIVALSPQGPGSEGDDEQSGRAGFGAYDSGPKNNTWYPVRLFFFLKKVSIYFFKIYF